METRNRNTTRPGRLDGDGLIVSKGIGGIAKQRTALSNVHGNSRQTVAEAIKPHVRTTRAQQLRCKMVEKNKPITKPTNVVRKVEPVKPAAEQPEVKADVEPMDVSMTSVKSETSITSVLSEAIEKVSLFDNSEDINGGPYVTEALEYTKYLEHINALKPRYLDGNTEVTYKMRTILVDWIVQVHQRFKLQSETLYYTIGIMDRYISQAESIVRKEMQLIGLTAMMLACKYEEIYMPDLQDFQFICDNAYNRDDFKRMELQILDVLNCNLAMSLSIQHLRRYSTVASDTVDGIQHSMAKYLLELSLMDYDLCTFKPSLIAAGGLRLSMELLGDQSWDTVLEHFSGYKFEDLTLVTNAMCKCLYTTNFTKSGAKYQAIKKKYANEKLFSVSKNPKLAENQDLIYARAKLGKESLDGR